MCEHSDNTAPETQEPTLRELVEFRDRYGISAFMVWCAACADLPRFMLMNLFKVGRHFGPLPESQYDNAALSEIIKTPLPAEVVDDIIAYSADGNFVSVESVRRIAGIFAN